MDGQATQTSRQRLPQRIRRCFMTGKQCIFCAQAAAEEQSGTSPATRNVFVIMPFRDNLNTAYDWSLRPYLQARLCGVLGPTGPGRQEPVTIRRADAFQNIGFVMCEKICRRIQETDLVVADLSVDNPNVFYELGLAVGLRKQLLIMADSACIRQRTESFWRALGIPVAPAGAQQPLDCIVAYPSVGFLKHDPDKPAGKLIEVTLGPSEPEMKVLTLIAERPPQPGRGEPPDPRKALDITVSFEEALRGAIGVAVTNIIEDKDPNREASRKAREILQKLPEREGTPPAESNPKESLKVPKTQYLFDGQGNYLRFEDLAPSIDKAFVCIVDLANEDPHAYFWLGYCHARGINVVPVYRSFGAGNSGQKRVLAFDIRALWYIDYDETEMLRLADTLQGVLEELITRDVPRIQRDRFWERLTRRSRIHIYTGAVHHRDLNREMVGDWDLRAVSELVRYLSSAEEPVIPELERPVYSPQTIKDKLETAAGQRKDSGQPETPPGEQSTRGNQRGDESLVWDDTESLRAYIELIKGELKNKNCLIVASADVNALTEVVLAHAYGMDHVCFSGGAQTSNQDNLTRAVVAMKKTTPQGAAPGGIIKTFFSREDANLEQSSRGFLVDGQIIQEPYYDQDRAEKVERFDVLAHLAIMHNPFSDPEHEDTLIVILDGVSGPGTFGLAEVLTGGTDPERVFDAEQLLTEINRQWQECETRRHKATERPGAPKPLGVEAIVKVTIKPPMARASIPPSGSPIGEQIEELVRRKFYDKREVAKWDTWKGARNIIGGNPRVFPN